MFYPLKTIRWFEWRLFLVPILGILIWFVWLKTAQSGRYPEFILPHPDAVRLRFIELYENGNLFRHIALTMREAFTGLFFATILAVVIGYIIARVRLMDYLLTPYLVFLQAVPIIAISPLIIIWFGTGFTGKAIIAGLITWFPMLIATITGIRGVSPNLRELMHSNVANPWQIFWHLEVPAALPELLGGFKIAVTLSVIGAAVGEFISATEGLGFLVVFGRATSDTPLVMCAIFLLTLVSLVLYGLTMWLEQLLLQWQRVGQN